MAFATEKLKSEQDIIRALFGKQASLHLAPISPFTPIQRCILKLLFIEGETDIEKIARHLGITQRSVYERIWGNGIFNAKNTDNSSLWLRREFIGIGGIIEIIKGKRPKNTDEIKIVLLGDVLLENYDPAAGEYYRKFNSVPLFYPDTQTAAV